MQIVGIFSHQVDKIVSSLGFTEICHKLKQLQRTSC